jgi:hypothetical protein
VLLVVALVGAASPARAWCEADCLAPAEAASHCGHEPAGDGTNLSAAAIDDCPVLESARPTPATRIDAQAAVVATPVPTLTARPPQSATAVRPRSATTVFERSTPLRI